MIWIWETVYAECISLARSGWINCCSMPHKYLVKLFIACNFPENSPVNSNRFSVNVRHTVYRFSNKIKRKTFTRTNPHIVDTHSEICYINTQWDVIKCKCRGIFVCVLCTLRKPHQLNATSEIRLLCLSILLSNEISYSHTFCIAVWSKDAHSLPIALFQCSFFESVWNELQCRVRCYTK